MEEASVAGESPDRSKQRESSAEPTSGSASPVPEARSSARDPRLAVARESISLGGVDTATRVFSVRDLPKTPEKPDESPAEAGTGGSGTGEPDDAPSAAETLPEDADGAKGPERDREDDSATAESPGDSTTGGNPADADTTDEPEDSATAESSGDSDAPDARLRDAVAAWVATGDEKTGPEGKGTEPADDPSEDESAPETDAATETDAAETRP
ncbi:UNVERIFIED_CONTAM: hypothetical protein RKD50_004212 [Streptomyces canus]